MTTARALVIVATYNERDNIRELLGRLLEISDVDVLVIDDNSPDGTGHIAAEHAAAEPRLTVVHRPGKAGVASAHVLGFRHALAKGYDVVIEMDADFSHRPEDVPVLIQACRSADIAVGSRRVVGGSTVGRSRTRNIITRVGGWYASHVLGLPIEDSTSGFRCSRRRALEAIDFRLIESRGYGFQIELNYAWTRAGMTFVEVPIVFHDRVAGASKVSSDIAFEALLVVLRLRLGRTPVALVTGVGNEPRRSEPMLQAARQILIKHARRFTRFAFVGASGVVVNMGALYLLVSGLHWPRLLAAAAATELATLNNFTWNDRWTFADSRADSTVVHRLARYHLVTLAGVLLALAVFTGLATGLSVNYLTANLIGIGCGLIFYYVSNIRFTWTLPGAGAKGGAKRGRRDRGDRRGDRPGPSGTGDLLPDADDLRVGPP